MGKEHHIDADLIGRAVSSQQRGVSLNVLLCLFAGALLLPAFVAAGLLFYREAQVQRDRLNVQVEQAVANLTDDVDRELGFMKATVGILAASQELAEGNYRHFHATARHGLQDMGLYLLVRDAAGQQLLNTRRPWGEPLPQETLSDIDDALQRPGSLHVSNVLIGAVRADFVVTVSAPVFDGGRLRGYLHLSINPERFLAVAQGQHLPPRWASTIADRNGVVIASVNETAARVGRQMPIHFRTVVEGRTSTSDDGRGETVVVASRRLSESGWIVIVAAPVSIAQSAFQAYFWSIIGTGAALLALALTLAFAMALIIGKPIHALARDARLVGEGSIAAPIGSRLREANEVSDALFDASRRLAEARQGNALLLRELAHRSKNLLTIVQTIAAQTHKSVPAKGFNRRLGERLAALARLQDVLVDGHDKPVSIDRLLPAQLAPFGEIGTRIVLDGPPLRLRLNAANAFGMAVNELATNAIKYGSLSVPEGRVLISWNCRRGADAATFAMTWREEGGPRVEEPARRGFGSTIISDMTAATVRGQADLLYSPTGVVWKLTCTLENVVDPKAGNV